MINEEFVTSIGIHGTGVLIDCKCIMNDEALTRYHRLTCFNIRHSITMLKEFHCINEQIQRIIVNIILQISLKNTKSLTTCTVPDSLTKVLKGYKNSNKQKL